MMAGERTANRWIGLALLAFVAASLGALAIRLVWRNRSTIAAPAVSSSPAAPAAPIRVYYFHGAVRCASCNTIEAFTSETLCQRFASELAQGRIAFESLNYEAPENAHFKKDFDLTVNSVVLVSRGPDGATRWKNLIGVWDYLGDKPGFFEFLSTAIAEFQSAAARP